MAATASMRGLAVACVLWAGLTPSSRADALATFDDGARRIVLMTQRCAAAAGGQQAQARSQADRLDGCWTVNARGNPVVRWRDGRIQELPESGVRLTPAYTALLDGPPRGLPMRAFRAPAGARTPGSRTSAWCVTTPSWPRPTWRSRRSGSRIAAP